jgi:hypothetical protein
MSPLALKGGYGFFSFFRDGSGYGSITEPQDIITSSKCDGFRYGVYTTGLSNLVQPKVKNAAFKNLALYDFIVCFIII